MGKLSPLTSLREADLQIPEGPVSGANLRETFRRLFAQLNPYFDGINKLASKGITLSENLSGDLVTGKFSHGAAQAVALKILKRAGSALVLSADGYGPLWASVQMAQIPPTSKQGPTANVTVYFSDPAAASVNCTILLLPEGSQTNTVPVYPATWIAPTLLNGFTNFGAGFLSAGYMKDPLGFVRLRGLVTNVAGVGATTNIFVLPSGYRPSARIGFSSVGEVAGTDNRLDIDNLGQVFCTGAVAANGFRFLDGITFDTR